MMKSNGTALQGGVLAVCSTFLFSLCEEIANSTMPVSHHDVFNTYVTVTAYRV